MQTLGKASILAVGTELTTGQITNRNAAWISERLSHFGVEVILHETVADDRPRIREALERCSQISQLIFVTGGLGPTTDDFTREVVAEWLNQPLKYDESSWQRIIERLGKLKIPVADSNRRQCYFPEGSEILPNSNGTAGGFTSPLPKTGGQIWVLPGPPNEVSSIWQESLEPKLRDLLKRVLPELKPLRLFTWGCIGKSEAEFGEITEKTLSGSGLQTGYRAHRPIVEVKVWCPEVELHEKMTWIRQLEAVLKPWTIIHQGEDLAEKLLQKLNSSLSIEIVDSATGGILSQRFSRFLREARYQALAERITLVTEWTQPQYPDQWVSSVLHEVDPDCITLALAGFTQDGQGCIGFKEEHHSKIEIFQSFYRSPELVDRMRSEMTEIALKRWSEWLDTPTH